MSRAVTTADFEELYRATARDVLSYVRRRTDADAEEIVAETYAVAWRRRDVLPAPMLRRAWLFGVARTLLRAEGRRLRRDGGLVRELAALPVPGPDPASNPASNSAGSPAVRVMAEAMARLAPAQAELLRLVAWEGLTPAELAVALGVRPGTARVRLHRARQALAADPEVRALVEGGVALPAS